MTPIQLAMTRDKFPNIITCVSLLYIRGWTVTNIMLYTAVLFLYRHDLGWIIYFWKCSMTQI